MVATNRPKVTARVSHPEDPPSNPETARGAAMSTPRADRLCCWMVELAARALPARQGQRYALDFIAELYDMPRARQFGHSVRILGHAWQLRSALIDAGTISLGDLMTTTTPTRIPLRCRFGAHDWQPERNPENGATYRRCSRCGKDNTDDFGGGPLTGSGPMG